MYKKTTPVTKQRHAGKKIMPLKSYHFAAGSYLVSLLTTEFNKAASAYPIVFVKDGDALNPFALLGLTQGENLFVGENGRWLTHYIPAVIRRYPFVLGRSEGSNDLMICIDDESGLLSDTEGDPLFDDQGEPGATLNKARDYLIELQRFSEMTHHFSKELSRLELLSPLKMQLTNTDGALIKIEGVHAVNETQLNELPDETFLELRKRGALGLIYAHLVSLTQIERLVRMKGERG